MIKCSAYITSENENELRDGHTAIECRQAHAALPLSLSSVSFPFVLRTKRKPVCPRMAWMDARTADKKTRLYAHTKSCSKFFSKSATLLVYMHGMWP